MKEVNHQVLLVVHKIQMQPHLCCRRSAENEWCMEAEIFWDNQQFLLVVGTWNSGTQSLSIPFLFSTSSSSSLNCKDILLGKGSEWNPSSRKRTTEFMQERRGISLIHMRITLNIFSRSHDSMWIGPIGRGRGRERGSSDADDLQKALQEGGRRAGPFVRVCCFNAPNAWQTGRARQFCAAKMSCWELRKPPSQPFKIVLYRSIQGVSRWWCWNSYLYLL